MPHLRSSSSPDLDMHSTLVAVSGREGSFGRRGPLLRRSAAAGAIVEQQDLSDASRPRNANFRYLGAIKEQQRRFL